MPPETPSSGPADGAEGQPTTAERRELDALFSLVYEELRRLASSVRRNAPIVTMNSTALVHEAWLKLKDSPHLAHTSPSHFKAIAARAMRQALVDAARKKIAHKRGAGEAIFVPLDESAGQVGARGTEILALDLGLYELEQMNSRQARVIEYKFFGGLEITELASVLGVSESVIERDWRAAKAWLAGNLRPAAKS